MPPSIKGLSSLFKNEAKAIKLPAMKVRGASLAAGEASLKQSLREGKMLAGHPLEWKNAHAGTPALKVPELKPLRNAISKVEKSAARVEAAHKVVAEKKAALDKFKPAPYTSAQKRADDKAIAEHSREVREDLARRGQMMTHDGKKILPAAQAKKYDLEQAQQAARVGMHDRAARIFNAHGISYDDPRKRAARSVKEEQKELDLAYQARVRAETAKNRLNILRAKYRTVDDIDELDRQIRLVAGELKLGVQGSLRGEGEVAIWDHNAPNGAHHEIWSMYGTSLKQPKVPAKKAKALVDQKPSLTSAVTQFQMNPADVQATMRKLEAGIPGSEIEGELIMKGYSGNMAQKVVASAVSTLDMKARHPVSAKNADGTPLRVSQIGGDGNKGQFAHSSLANLCVCGHNLGEHTGARPHECLEEGCGCEKFRRAKVPKA